MIKISQLTAGYGSQTIVSRLSFLASPQNSPVVLAGRNGSGKSTLLKAILGEVAHTGHIEIENKNQGIGWFPQNYKVSMSIPVVDFVAMGAAQPSGIFPAFASYGHAAARLAMNELQIAHLAEKRTDEVSGGEWQLVCLAQLAVQPTHIWLLDEPTASLDIYYKSMVFSYLWKKAAEGKTILLATHDLPFLPTHSGSLLLFQDNYSILPISAKTIEQAVNQIKMHSC